MKAPILKDRALEAKVEEAVKSVCEAFRAGCKLLVCGNGGSAADSSHIAGELVKSFEKKRPLARSISEDLKSSGERGLRLAAMLEGGFQAISLASDSAVMSAIANDIGQEAVFAQQVASLGRSGDVLLCISTSGRSENVINAAVTGKAVGMKVISLTGAVSELSDIADVGLVTGGSGAAEIQSRQQVVYHEICRRIEEKMP